MRRRKETLEIMPCKVNCFCTPRFYRRNKETGVVIDRRVKGELERRKVPTLVEADEEVYICTPLRVVVGEEGGMTLENLEKLCFFKIVNIVNGEAIFNVKVIRAYVNTFLRKCMFGKYDQIHIYDCIRFLKNVYSTDDRGVRFYGIGEVLYNAVKEDPTSWLATNIQHSDY